MTEISITLLAWVGLSWAGATSNFLSKISFATVTLISSFGPFAHSFRASGCSSSFKVLTTRCATRSLAMMSACVLTYVAGARPLPAPPPLAAATGSVLLSMTMDAVAVYCLGQIMLAKAMNTTAATKMPTAISQRARRITIN